MAHEDDLRTRTKLAGQFLATYEEHRSTVRLKSQGTSVELLIAHQQTLSAVVSYQQRIQGKKYDSGPESISGRMALVAQFIQGISITVSSVSEGLYPQAANLLKQELETLLAIDEFEEGIRKDKSTPRFNGKMKNWRRFYGRLNELAHPARSDVVKSYALVFDESRSGPTTIPQFDPETYRRLLGAHTLMMTVFFAQMRRLFVQAFYIDADNVEESLVRSAIAILLEEEVASG